jgi:MraZ protein
MLRGEAEYALDEKGRVVIPPKFRATLGERVIVTRWIDPCLVVFSPAEWQSLEEKLRSQPLKNRDFVRLLLSAAEDCDLDRQGRIYLPPHLRAYGGITRGVTIIGVGNRLEFIAVAHAPTQSSEGARNAGQTSRGADPVRQPIQ